MADVGHCLMSDDEGSSGPHGAGSCSSASSGCKRAHPSADAAYAAGARATGAAQPPAEPAPPAGKPPPAKRQRVSHGCHDPQQQLSQQQQQQSQLLRELRVSRGYLCALSVLGLDVDALISARLAGAGAGAGAGVGAAVE
jgi:hypothetical protein